MLYSVDYRFHQRILENYWIFNKKNGDTSNTKHFQNSIVYYLFFYFLIYLTSFSSILPVHGFKKKIKIFVLCYCMDLRFYQKILQKLRYLKSKISIKFHSLLFRFYFFSIFGILFSISPIQTCPKIMEFFVVFYWKG